MHRADSDEPLLGGAPARPSTSAAAWYAFLEGQTPAGARYEALTVFLIFVNVVAFVVGTLFVVEYNPEYAGKCSATCDLILFGNDGDNA